MNASSVTAPEHLTAQHDVAAVLRTLNHRVNRRHQAVLLHAISDDARRFCEKAGFSASPVDPMTVTIALAAVEKALVDRPR